MIALLILSLAAHIAANLICPVWRTAPESANSLAVLGYLAQAVAVAWLLAKPVRRWWGRFRPDHGIHWIDRDGGGPRAWLALLAVGPLAFGGCAADSNRIVTAHGVIELGRATAGTDEEFEAEIPVGKPTGVAALWGSAPVMKIKSKRTGAAETMQDAITGATIIGSIIGVGAFLPSVIKAILPAGANPKVVGPADRIAVPAPPDAPVAP